MDINETMDSVVEEVSDKAEVVKNAADEAFKYVSSLDGSTIAKIGVVGGIVGAAAGAFVFKPIADKIAAIPKKVKNLAEESTEKLSEKERIAMEKKIAKMQAKLDALDASKEN